MSGAGNGGSSGTANVGKNGNARSGGGSSVRHQEEHAEDGAQEPHTARGFALTTACALLCFALLMLAVGLSTRTALPWDGATHAWSVHHRPAVAVSTARAVTATGTGVVPYLLAAAAGWRVGHRAGDRARGVAVICAFVACLALGQALRFGAMELMARPRPRGIDWAAHASGWSFPSGHTTTAALAAGLLLVALRLRAPAARHTVAALGTVVVCWAVAVGVTRVYLGVHWFTDVLGGWLFAVCWLGICVLAASRWAPARLRDPDGGDPPDGGDAAAAGNGPAGGPHAS
ncbi:phosphatase PAP2 family protein [Streptomyces sp. ODS28]|uniref:phosphatase PAP2 family protein n=1 Tax=Streptomyces sp. ODS28 TaxID=3136688 RepID=UPI0031EF76E8